MITIDNYNSEVKKIDWTKVPKKIKDSRKDFESIMEFYHDDLEIKQTLDSYFKKLDNSQKEIDKKTISEKKIKTKSNKNKKVAKTVEPKKVAHYNKEFLLIRRFYNLITKKNTATFRQIQLLFMAFQKAIVSKDVNKQNVSNTELFIKVNKKVVKLFDIIKEGEQNVKIRSFSDKAMLSQMEALVKGVRVDYAVTLLRSFISLQNTRPDAERVERLLKRFINGIEKGKITKENRLWDEVQAAVKEMKEYIKNPKDEIDVVAYALNAAKRKKCDNRVKCDGLNKNGRLKKGYKFIKGGGVVKVSKKKTKVNNKPKRINHLGTAYIEVSEPKDKIPIIPSSHDEQVITTIYDEPKKDQNTVFNEVKKRKSHSQIAKTPKEVISSSELMNMKFETISFNGKWQDFMQEPAKRMNLGVIGKPKNGKTAGSTALANELTNHGDVLYIFADQGVNKSTQKLWELSGLSNKQNAHISTTRNLKDIHKLCSTGLYDYVFIDMINTLIHKTGIKYHEFENQFIKRYPDISFVLIFESTKNGDFKGDQGWTHIVDQIINVQDFVMYSIGRYGSGKYVIWKEGLKSANPKKFKEIYSEETQIPSTIDVI